MTTRVSTCRKSFRSSDDGGLAPNPVLANATCLGLRISDEVYRPDRPSMSDVQGFPFARDLASWPPPSDVHREIPRGFTPAGDLRIENLKSTPRRMIQVIRRSGGAPHLDLLQGGVGMKGTNKSKLVHAASESNGTCTLALAWRHSTGRVVASPSLDMAQRVFGCQALWTSRMIVKVAIQG